MKSLKLIDETQNVASNAESYWEVFQMSNMESSAKIVNG